MTKSKKRQSKLTKWGRFLNPKTPIKKMLLFVVLFAAIGGGYFLLKSFALVQCGSFADGTYIYVNNTCVNVTLSRSNPNYQLMIDDHASYVPWFNYGPGFTIKTKTTGISYYLEPVTTNIGFYESSTAQVLPTDPKEVHTYFSPTNITTNGIYTSKKFNIKLHYYVPPPVDEWRTGPTMSYRITVTQ